MGSEACRAVAGDDDLALVVEIGRGDALQAIVDAGADVAVDFTTAEAVADNVRFCVANAVHAVVGTTGISEAELADMRAWVADGRANVVIAPNFAIGAVLMMMFAARAARYFDAVEIVERHHEHKRDAPSGTALRTAALMSDARSRAWPRRPEGRDLLPESRGANADGIRIHSLRLPGSVAHQEVILGGRGETLTIRHDSLDRASFMPGVLLAVKRVASLDGLTVGLERVLEG
jgi:4-hydroxy-tetrahydrodipicolinate reductase